MKRRFLPIFCLLIALWPEWLWYAQRMTDGSDEPYGIIALLAGFGILWRDRRDVRIENRNVLLSVSLVAIHALSRPWVPAMISAVLAIGIIAVATGTIRTKPGIWATFALSLPLIASLQFYIGYPLRMAAAVSAESILTFTPLEVTRSGTELFWQGNRVGVDPPCSGVEMLWAGLFIVSLLCAFRRYSMIRTIVALAVGSVSVVVSNCARVTLLFLKEAGIVSLPEWTHEGIGIALFGILVWLLSRGMEKGRPESEAKCPPLVSQTPRYLLANAAACLAIALGPLLLKAEPSAVDSNIPFPGWPEKWDDRYLETLPLTESEHRFAENFPGKISAFTTGPDKIIMRWVTRPTRKLHSASDCLRAVGFEIANERDGTFIATSEQGTYLVEESIYNKHKKWDNVSRWFWASTFQKTEGPWWAVTRMQLLCRD